MIMRQPQSVTVLVFITVLIVLLLILTVMVHMRNRKLKSMLEEQMAERRLLDKICADFTAVYYVELNTGSFEILHINDGTNVKKMNLKQCDNFNYSADQYAIQYLYENSTDNSIWSAILESNGLSDMLNRIEYATDLYKSDRELMTSYQNAVKKVEDWTMQLADEMDSLLALQDKYQTQQGELKTLMAKLEKQKDAYAQQLAEAQKQAQDYKKTISKQEAIIRAQEAAAARANANTYDGGGTGASGGIASDSYLKDPDCNPSQTTDVSGADIVAFAQQFVGNPYVWGGNSLTNGVDCSGFVHQVYAHFGISTPRYSQAFKSVGQPVSYQNIQAGDVVVYPGHVAIYIGNGNIVEAQSTRAGITNSRPVNCHTITAIRRLV